jgi:choline dehydrogenase-like flavoprotein
MGTVCDTEARVKGVSGLSVADASLVPVPLGGHPMSTLYAVAEMLADLVRFGGR